jgi:uncharacterized membrane protein YgcG
MAQGNLDGMGMAEEEEGIVDEGIVGATQAGSLLGPHINGDYTRHLPLLERWQPAVALLLDPPPGYAAQIKRRSPNTLIVQRIYQPDHQVEAAITQSAQAAGKWAANLVLAQVKDHPGVDAWIVVNEVSQQSAEQVAKLGVFSMTFCSRLQEYGLRGCIGGFGVGWPKLSGDDGAASLRAFANAMQFAATNDHWLAIHQYGAAPLTNTQYHSYHLLRWQAHVLPWFRANGVAIPKYIVTETGTDLGVVPGHQGEAGWRRGYSGNANAYANDLLWLEAQMRRDERCLGGTLFCLGSNGDPKWSSFQIDGEVAEKLAATGGGGSGDDTGGGGGSGGSGGGGGGSTISLAQALLAAGQQHQVIQLNPQAALQRAILGAGFVPTSAEFEVGHGGASYVAQRAERLSDGAVRVYFVLKGDWGNVQYVTR